VLTFKDRHGLDLGQGPARETLCDSLILEIEDVE
jgi:hypothetical protein